MGGNLADSLELLQQAVFKDHELGHGLIQHPYDYASELTPISPLGETVDAKDVNDLVQKLGVGVMGKYWGAFPGLNDREFSFLRMTTDGKLMVDATVSVTVSGGFTNKAYWEGVAGNVETIINFGFAAKEVLIYNDGTKTINYELAGACAAGVNTMYGGEAMVDDFTAANIHVITYGVGETSNMRVWARG